VPSADARIFDFDESAHIEFYRVYFNLTPKVALFIPKIEYYGNFRMDREDSRQKAQGGRQKVARRADGEMSPPALKLRKVNSKQEAVGRRWER
jgi:hypothetical protein